MYQNTNVSRASVFTTLILLCTFAANGAELLAQNYQVVLRVPSPLITAGPGLVRFSDRTLLAVCPVDGYRKGGENANNSNYAVHLVVSRDAGRSWREAAPPLPFWLAIQFTFWLIGEADATC